MPVQPEMFELQTTVQQIVDSVRFKSPGPPVPFNILTQTHAQAWVNASLSTFRVLKVEPTDEWWHTETGQSVAACQWWLNEGQRCDQRDAVRILWPDADLGDQKLINKLSFRFRRMTKPRYRRPASTIQENFYKQGLKDRNVWYFRRDEIEALREQVKQV